MECGVLPSGGRAVGRKRARDLRRTVRRGQRERAQHAGGGQVSGRNGIARRLAA